MSSRISQSSTIASSPQPQRQTRGILRQSHTSASTRQSSPSPREPAESTMSNSRKTASQQQRYPEIRPQSHGRFSLGKTMPAPRVSAIDIQNDSVARACGLTPSPAQHYMADFHRPCALSSNQRSETVYSPPEPPRPHWDNELPGRLLAQMHDLLQDKILPPYERLGCGKYLGWDDVRRVYTREVKHEPPQGVHLHFHLSF